MSRSRPFPRFVSGNSRASRLVALLASSAVSLALVSQACAEAASAAAPVDVTSPTAVGEVVVTGDAYANARTIQDKKNLSVVSDGISATQISLLPEFGLGDALASVPGVTFVINNGRGEDQFMTIRGLNPDYDSVTVDGLVLPSTEETVRSLSFDVLPAVLISQADVLKTWTVDQPADAVGGVTALKTRSAFDHPGLYIAGHLDAAYWEDTQQLHSNVPSGQGDIVVSKTFGRNDEFGFLVLGSYYQRSSNTLNTYTLPYSYYNFTGTPGTYTSLGSAQKSTSTSTTLSPTQNLAGDVPIPDRHRWYLYDNVRTRPGAFTRFDFDDHQIWHAHLSGGVFGFKNDENRYSQYLNRVGPATIQTSTTGGFGAGSGEVDFDKYIQFRTVAYVDGGVGVNLTPNTHVDLTANYGVGHYRQNTAEDQFTQPYSAANPGALAFNYNLTTETAPLFTPVSLANFYNPALYNQVYHLDAVDQSKSKLPQVKLDLNHNFDPTDRGFGFDIGGNYRDLHQAYSYEQVRYNANGPAPTLATIGADPRTPPLYDGYGQTLLLVNPGAVDRFLANNPGLYTRNAGDTLSNTVNNYVLDEEIADGYVQFDYRTNRLFVLAGVRYEQTRENIQNFLPQPLSSATNFVENSTTQNYDYVLPSLNVSYKPLDNVVLRGAISETLARPEYSQLAQNSAGSLVVTSNTASEAISNPALKPRKSTNYDVSIEWYPAPGALASVALFDKEIKNEIITLTTELNNVTVAGDSQPVQLTITQPQNASHARVRGVELNLVESRLEFLPGMLKGFGGRFNAALMDYDAPYILMSNGVLRHLPQLISSSRDVVNAAVFYNWKNWGGEVSYNLTGKMPISFDTNNAANDQWWAAIKTFDLQTHYTVNSRLELRFQIKNLTDARPQKVVGPTQNLNYSTLENGRAYFLGVAFRY